MFSVFKYLVFGLFSLLIYSNAYAILHIDGERCSTYREYEGIDYKCNYGLYDGGPRAVGIGTRVLFECKVDVVFVRTAQLRASAKTKEYVKTLLDTFGFLYVSETDGTSQWLPLEDYLNLEPESLKEVLASAPECLRNAKSNFILKDENNFERTLKLSIQNYKAIESYINGDTNHLAEF